MLKNAGYPVRAEKYSKIFKKSSESLNPLVGIAGVNFVKFDTQHTALTSRIFILRLFLANKLYIEKYKKPPKSIQRLLEILGEDKLHDPLVEAPFLFEVQNGTWFLCSRAVRSGLSYGELSERQKQELCIPLENKKIKKIGESEREIPLLIP